MTPTEHYEDEALRLRRIDRKYAFRNRCERVGMGILFVGIIIILALLFNETH